MGEVGVGDVLEGVGKSQTHRLDQMVISVGGLGTHRRDVVTFNDVQRFQSGDTLVAGWAFPAGDAPVAGGDGFLPIGSVVGHVGGGHTPALLLNELRCLRRDIAFVEGFRPSLGHGPQGTAQRGDAHHLAVLGGLSIQQHLLTGGEPG